MKIQDESTIPKGALSLLLHQRDYYLSLSNRDKNLFSSNIANKLQLKGTQSIYNILTGKTRMTVRFATAFNEARAEHDSIVKSLYPHPTS